MQILTPISIQPSWNWEPSEPDWDSGNELSSFDSDTILTSSKLFIIDLNSENLDL